MFNDTFDQLFGNVDVQNNFLQSVQIIDVFIKFLV